MPAPDGLSGAEGTTPRQPAGLYHNLPRGRAIRPCHLMNIFRFEKSLTRPGKIHTIDLLENDFQVLIPSMT
jgi:hypothetical protein